jgi:hypothetical protein
VCDVAEHKALEQSLAPTHDLPSSHVGQDEPQSMSVSVPFLTPSSHCGAWHSPPVHTPLTQSVLPVLQPLSVGQGSQLPPPQSVSVSAPFLIPSVHVGGWQTLPPQTPL